jgi:protein phosphatase 1L
MTAISLYSSVSFKQEFADWLLVKSNETTSLSQIQYHVVGRAILLGTSLGLLAEAVTRIALSCFVFIGYLLSFGFVQGTKSFSIEQLEKGIHAGLNGLQCCHAILSPQELSNQLKIEQPLTPHMREARLRSASLIPAKLQKQFELCQKQAKEEPDKAFQYMIAPDIFTPDIHTQQIAGHEVAVCHFMGRRANMEDEHLATTFELNLGGNLYPVQLFGIFDGHAGREAACYVKRNLENKLKETLHEFCADGLTDDRIWNALKITFVKLNEEFPHYRSGTTATVALILDGKLWTANAGDSRTILDNGIQLSEDAKPSDPRYAKGILNRGAGIVDDRINGRLAMARAIGDHDVGGVSARPKNTIYPVRDLPLGSHLILGCDGIYDVSSTRQIAAAVRDHKDNPIDQVAKNIVYSAFRAMSYDNLSLMIVKL